LKNLDLRAAKISLNVWETMRRSLEKGGVHEPSLPYVSILVVHVTEYLDIGKFPDKIW
jgi:hypothetical protein